MSIFKNRTQLEACFQEALVHYEMASSVAHNNTVRIRDTLRQSSPLWPPSRVCVLLGATCSTNKRCSHSVPVWCCDDPIGCKKRPPPGASVPAVLWQLCVCPTPSNTDHCPLALRAHHISLQLPLAQPNTVHLKGTQYFTADIIMAALPPTSPLLPPPPSAQMIASALVSISQSWRRATRAIWLGYYAGPKCNYNKGELQYTYCIIAIILKISFGEAISLSNFLTVSFLIMFSCYTLGCSVFSHQAKMSH